MSIGGRLPGSEHDLVIAAKRSTTGSCGQLVHRDVLDERRSLLVCVLVLDNDVVQSKWIKHIQHFALHSLIKPLFADESQSKRTPNNPWTLQTAPYVSARFRWKSHPSMSNNWPKFPDVSKIKCIPSRARSRKLSPLNQEALGGPGMCARGDLMTSGRTRRQMMYETPSRRAALLMLGSIAMGLSMWLIESLVL